MHHSAFAPHPLLRHRTFRPSTACIEYAPIRVTSTKAIVLGSSMALRRRYTHRRRYLKHAESTRISIGAPPTAPLVSRRSRPSRIGTTGTRIFGKMLLNLALSQRYERLGLALRHLQRRRLTNSEKTGPSGPRHHAPVRGLTHIRKRDDCFGQFLVRVIRNCGECREIRARGARAPGSTGQRRSRSPCQNCWLTEARRPHLRGVAF